MTEIQMNIALTVLGVASHIIKQMLQERVEGYPPDFAWIRRYFLYNWPQNIASLIGTASLFLIGIALGDLNPYSAWLAGWSGNSAGEFLGSRRIAARSEPPPPQE